MAAERIDYGTLATRILDSEPQMRRSVTVGTVHFDARRRAAYAQLDSDRWRDWAERVRSHALAKLPEYLEQAEERLVAAGAVVHWAERPEEVHAVLARIIRDHGIERAVKGKSMLSEELRVNGFLEARGVHVLETDLGEYIVQLLGEPPSHILAPAIHRGLEDVRRLFAERLGTAPDASPERLAAAARGVLRDGFLRADLGITGANFLVAESGTVVLIENEGNIRLATSLPRVHVALVGIEKLLPRLSDLAGFLQLTSRAATGQPIGTFVSLIHGPRGATDPDGPEALHVVLVDNGRAALLGDDEAWETLRCIRCSACLNACPVFRQTGGYAYGWTYSGPIGAVLAPGLIGLERAASLPQASSLCGACAEACPVRIPIPKLLLSWRRRAVEQGASPITERAMIRAYTRIMTRPAWYRAASRALRLVPASLRRQRLLPVVRAWSRVRGALEPSPEPFRALWRKGIR